MADLVIKEVITRKDLRDFIYLPSRVHKNDPAWLPPIYNDEWELYDKKKNKSFQYADGVLYLAYKGDKPVGRIMGIINNRYNSIKNEKHSRFCFMECYNDREVFSSLIRKVEEWARSKGMVKMVGPLGFSDKDPQGFQIEGFDQPHVLATATNFPYMNELIEGEGYTKEVDLVDYVIQTPEKLPEVYMKIFEKVSGLNDCKIIEFHAKKELKPMIIPILELMNQTFSDIYGFVPLNDKEKKDLAARYLPIIDPEFVKVVEVKGEPVGFIIGMPDISEGIRKANGKLFPFGIFKIIKALKTSKKLVTLLGGITKPYRGQGLDILMAVRMVETCIRRKIEYIDSHLILESNSRMRGEYEKLGGKVIKRFRIYQKPLVQELKT